MTNDWEVTIGDAKDTEARYGHRSNRISTTKYSILTFLPKNLFEQFHRAANIFFLFMAVIALIPATQALNPETAAAPLLTVLLVTAIRDGLEDRKRSKYDQGVNHRHARVVQGDAVNDHVQWQHVHLGSIVMVKNHESVPADIVLLSTSDDTGLCFVETSNLDGETNLKPRRALAATGDSCLAPADCQRLKGTIFVDPPNNNLFALDGKVKLADSLGETRLDLNNIIMRGCELRNTEWVYGVVIYTGHDTKVMQNMLQPRVKRTTIDYMMNHQILGVFGILFIICTAAAIFSSHWTSNDLPDFPYVDSREEPTTQGIINFFAFVLLLHSMVPLSVYVSVELVRIAHAHSINSDLQMYDEAVDTPAQVRDSSLSEHLGMVRYLLSDKTGTLTQNLMEFAGASIGGRVYGDLCKLASTVPRDDFRQNSHLPPRLCPHSRKMHHFTDPTLQEDINLPTERHEMFMLVLALCHTVVPNKNSPGSMEVEGPDHYNAQSPDEGALVTAARDLGYSFFQRNSRGIFSLNILGMVQRFAQLATLEFSSDRKRMSVIVRALDGPRKGGIYVLMKGADDAMLARVVRQGAEEEIARKTEEHLTMFSLTGLRTLVLASRPMTEEEYEHWIERWTAVQLSDFGAGKEEAERAKESLSEELEQGMMLLGATAVEDKLQVDVAETIAKLKEAGIAVWMLTGDKQETAISIGYACRLLSSDMIVHTLNVTFLEGTAVCEERLERLLNETLGPKAVENVRSQRNERFDTRHQYQHNAYGVVVDGKTIKTIFETSYTKLLFIALMQYATGVVVCRCAPLQKAQIVGLVRSKFGAVTLAIGDGANDVSMLKVADIGVGISGKEGMQAVLASDYSIAQFRFLQRLLLVHGRWFYNRIVWVVFYFFYKNYAYVLVNFWFAWFSAASGSTIYENRYIMLYNVIFTSVPGLLVGMFDQDVSARGALENPALYRDSQANASFSHRYFWLWIVDAWYQSLVTFGIPLLVLYNTPVSNGYTYGLWEIGGVMFTAVVIMVNIKLLLDAQSWNRPVLYSVLGSILVYLIFLFTYHAILPSHNDAYYNVYNLMAYPHFWWSILAVNIVGLMPYCIVRAIRAWYYPSLAQIIREREILHLGSQRSSIV